MQTDIFLRKVGNSIRRRRESLGLSQEAFADQIGMHRTYYGAIERGEKNLSLTTIIRVCVGLECKAWEIFREAAP
ncbi:MAG: helix-turn-helix transcriptional regulator [Porticoccaceae bacterium]